MEPPLSHAYRRLLGAAVPLLALAGLLSGSSALLGLALAWAASLIAGWWLARARLSGLMLRREVYPSAFEDDAVLVELRLENRSRHAIRLLELGDGFGAAVAERQALLEPGPLAAQHRRRLRYRTFCSRRWGVYGLGPCRLAASDPLGLFRAERLFPELGWFSVFPKVHDVKALDVLGARSSQLPQEASQARAGLGALDLGVRDYFAGDDRRRIHWPASARRGTPMVRERERDLVPYLSLFIDLERRHRAGTGLKSTHEYVARTAASLLWSAARRGHLTQVFAAGARELFVAPGCGELHLASALDELIRARQAGQTPVLDLVARELPALPGGSTVAILFGSARVDTERLASVLQDLGARGVRPALLFVDQDSFLPIERWALPAEAAERQRAELGALLQATGAAVAWLGAGHDLATELGRADLFEAAL